MSLIVTRVKRYLDKKLEYPGKFVYQFMNDFNNTISNVIEKIITFSLGYNFYTGKRCFDRKLGSDLCVNFDAYINLIRDSNNSFQI